MIDPADIQRRARLELERRMGQELGRYWTPNGGIERFLKLIAEKCRPNDGRIYTFVLEAGNGVGKTSTGCNIASYLVNQYPNPYLDAVPYFKNFRRPNRGRILTTATAAETVYDEELARWLPKGRCRSSKNGHKFQQHYEAQATGSAFDILTFKQDPMEGESVTLDWAIIDEPCSRRHYSALRSRFRFGGIIIFILTPLEGAAWMREVLLTPDRLDRDVFFMRLSSEENCREHGVRGFLPHVALEDMWRDFDENELAARRDGIPLSLSGSIYRNYVDEPAPAGHLMETLEGYYATCWQRRRVTLWEVVDPHDRKPWAMGWLACFPNGARIFLSEWPDESMPAFPKIKSWTWGIKRYAQLSDALEKSWGREIYATIMDPNYGPSAAIGPDAVTSIAAEYQKALAEIQPGRPRRRMIFPSDAVNPGHLAVKAELGDPARGVTPAIYFMSHCRNVRFGMANYAIKENRDETKGLSEAPVLQYKDFPDLVRYGIVGQSRYVDEDLRKSQDDGIIYQPRVHGNGRVGV